MKQNYVCLKGNELETYKLNEYEKMNDFSYIIGFWIIFQAGIPIILNFYWTIKGR